MKCEVWSLKFEFHTSHFILQVSNFALHTMKCEVWSLNLKLQTADFTLQTSHFKHIIYEVWSMKCEVWSLKSEVKVWSLKSEVWRMKSEVWNVKFGSHHRSFVCKWTSLYYNMVNTLFSNRILLPFPWVALRFSNL